MPMPLGLLVVALLLRPLPVLSVGLHLAVLQRHRRHCLHLQRRIFQLLLRPLRLFPSGSRGSEPLRLCSAAVATTMVLGATVSGDLSPACASHLQRCVCCERVLEPQV